MRRKSLGDLIADGLLGVSRHGGEHRRDWAGGDIAAGELRVRCLRALDRFVDDHTSLVSGFPCTRTAGMSPGVRP
jgi:hypothetical protein